MSIEAKNITKRFGQFTALDEVSLEIPSGELVALLGPSGSGKTTLVKLLVGLYRPHEGHIYYNGTREDEIEIERRRRERNAETRQQCFACALLRRRESALAQHEAAYGSAKRSRARFGHCTRFQPGSLSFRSIVPAVVAPFTLYSSARVSASFHLAVASAQPFAFHTSSLRRLSGVIRQMAISLLHCVWHTSAVTSRCRSGESCGSVGSS